MDERDDDLDRAERAMRAALDARWRVFRGRKTPKAHWRWFTVKVKRKSGGPDGLPWRARLRDGFPRVTVAEHWADDPVEALAPVLREARAAADLCDGGFGLVSNPSKTWLAHRLWQAVKKS